MEKSNAKASRKRPARNDKHTKQKDAYKCISFVKRPSTGRPGSPHRYFDDSFSVTFGDASIETGSDEAAAHLNSDGAEAVTATLTRTNSSHTPEQLSPRLESSMCTVKHQIVHRHLNGLCIVTAGNILDHFTDRTSPKPSVSLVEYQVNISRGAQSARGKLRAKKSKWKSSKSSDAPNEKDGSKMVHDGTVQPHDVLCTATLSNGMKYEFQCCVAGTVLELNRRLVHADSDDADATTQDAIVHTSHGSGDVNAEEDKRINEVDIGSKQSTPDPINPSLLLTDPLLDGYLAVILPKGHFPPNNSFDFTNNASIESHPTCD